MHRGDLWADEDRSDGNASIYRKDLLRMLPLRDEADAKYALTDSMVSSMQFSRSNEK